MFKNANFGELDGLLPVCAQWVSDIRPILLFSYSLYARLSYPSPGCSFRINWMTSTGLLMQVSPSIGHKTSICPFTIQLSSLILGHTFVTYCLGTWIKKFSQSAKIF